MRTLFLLFALVISPISIAEDFFYSDAEYSFRPKFPVYVIQVSQREQLAPLNVCYASFQRKGAAKIFVGASAPEDVGECTKVSTFGGTDIAFTRRALLKGWQKVGRPTVVENEQVKIKGKTWTMVSDPTALFQRTGVDSGGTKIYAKICIHQLRPLDRIYDRDAPEKTLFCKPLNPKISVQALNAADEPIFQNGKAEMIETVVCPLPTECVKLEWEIVPSLRIMPGAGATTAHAGTADASRVHKESKLSTP